MELRPQLLVDVAVINKLAVWWQRTVRWQYSGLLFLVVLSLGLHLAIIMNPPDLVFDEYHYVNDARSIIKGEGPQRGEHPPLARLIITTGIRLLGDNQVGWRLPAILFGIGCVVLFWFICRALNMRRGAIFLATFLFLLENMTFLQASVAMLDVYNLFFLLGAFLFYLRGGYLVSGISVALGTLCKLIGGLVVPAIFVHWFLSGRPRKWYFLIMLLSGPVFFFVLLPSFDLLLSGQLMDPIGHIKSMITQSESLTFATVTHGAASRPWFWVALPLVMWYWYDPHYIGAVSFNMWALIVPAFAYMVFRWFKTRDSASLFGASWFAGLYLLWIPLSLVTNRISYIYYFYPAIGAICLGLGIGLDQLLDVWRQRAGKKARRDWIAPSPAPAPAVTEAAPPALAGEPVLTLTPELSQPPQTGPVRIGHGRKIAWTCLIGVIAYLAIHVAVFVILSPVFSRWISVIPIPPS